MVRIAGGLPQDEFERRPRMYTNINSSSPLKHDSPMLDGAMRLARRGQPMIVTPFTLAGAMAPVTHRRRRRAADGGGAGCHRAPAGDPSRCRRCVYRLVHLERRHEVRRTGLRHAGIHPRHADVRPDGALLQPAAPRLQRLRLPTRRTHRRRGRASTRSGPACSPAHERRLSRRRLARRRPYRLLREVRHGLRDAAADPCTTSSPPHRHLTGRPRRRRHRAVGPHGHFFGAEHTQARYTTAFYAPFLSDWRNYEAWDRGRRGPDTEQRANHIWKAILAEFEPPPMDRRHPRRARRLRRPPQGRGRRSHRLLTRPAAREPSLAKLGQETVTCDPMN